MKKTNDVADEVAQRKCSNNNYYASAFKYIYIYIYMKKKWNSHHPN